MSGLIAGAISGISLTSFLHMLAMDKIDALVEISASGKRGFIYFQHGELIDAQTEQEQELEAIRSMLQWQDPIIGVKPAVARTRTLHVSLEQLVKECTAQPLDLGELYVDPSQKHNNAYAGLNRYQVLIKKITDLVLEVRLAALMNAKGEILAINEEEQTFLTLLRYALHVEQKFQDLTGDRHLRDIALHTSQGETIRILPTVRGYIGLCFAGDADVGGALGQVRLFLQQFSRDVH